MKINGLKWSHYQELYERHLSGDSILEVGVWNGASLLKHRERFKHIFGIDNRFFTVPGCKVYIGSVSHAVFMESTKSDIVSDVGQLDAIIDDASHRPYHQHNTFKALWPILKDGGTYCIEDLQVSNNIKWSIWTALGLPSVPKLLKELQREQHAWSTVYEFVPRKRPYEIHIYPNIIFIKKCVTTIRAVNTGVEL